MPEISAPTEPRLPSTWLSRLAAICEVVGALLGGIVLGRLVQGALGVESWKAVQAAMIASGEPDFWQLARLATIEQLLKYGFAFLLFYGIGRWHRDRRLPAYGLRLGRRSVGSLAAIGVVGWAAGGILPYSLQVAATLWPALGQGPEHWQLFPSSWSIGFLAYMAAASFLLVPFVEELYARGYMVTRFAEEYGRAGSLLLSALFFALAHGQYFKPEALSIGMLASLVLGSVIYGYIFLRTGSLLPVILGHALINFPTPPTAWGQPAILAIMAIVLLAARRPLGEWARGAFGIFATAHWGRTVGGMLVLLACLGVVALAESQLPYVAFGLLLVSVVAHARERRGRAADS